MEPEIIERQTETQRRNAAPARVNDSGNNGGQPGPGSPQQLRHLIRGRCAEADVIGWEGKRQLGDPRGRPGRSVLWD